MAALWRILLLLAAGCAAPTPAATPTLSAIFAPQPSATATAIVPPTQPVLLTPSSPPRATVMTLCADGASFIEDLTIPDGTEVLPGELLDKRWSVSNSGSCDWGPDYRLVQVGTSEIQGPAEVRCSPPAPDRPPCGKSPWWRLRRRESTSGAGRRARLTDVSSGMKSSF